MASPVPQQFCLRWNNHQAALVSVFEHLLQSEAFVDVTLAVEGLFLRAHKLVLSACSPYFQTVFASHPAKHPIIILKDVKYADLRALLDFMYRGEVSVDQDQLSSFLRLAENLRIRGLAEVCDETASAEAREQQLQEHQRLIFDSLERHRLGLSVDLSPHALLAQSHRSAAAGAGERGGEDSAGQNMEGPLALASTLDRTHGGGALSASSSALAFASPAALPLFTNPLSLANAAAASNKRPGSPSSLVKGSTVYRRKRGRPARLHSESPSLVPSPLELLESRVETQSSSSSSTPNPQSTSTPGPRPNSPHESNTNAQEDTSAQFDESVKSEDRESPRPWSISADPVPGTSKAGADEEEESPTRRKDMRDETTLEGSAITIKAERVEIPEDPLSIPAPPTFMHNYGNILPNRSHLEAKRGDIVSIETRAVLDRRTLREHHNLSYRLESEFSYACSECGAYFRNKPSYKYHVSSHHHRQLAPRDNVRDAEKRGDENDSNRKRSGVNPTQDEEFVKRIIESVRAELAANGESSTRRGYRKHS